MNEKSVYRIYTEDMNRPEVVKVVSKYFDSFTVIPTLGYWKGIEEHSLIIEVIGLNQLIRVKQVAIDIKALNKQAAVLVTMNSINSVLI